MAAPSMAADTVPGKEKRRLFFFPRQAGQVSIMCYKTNRADNFKEHPCWLSALRLCVWLFDNRNIQLSYFN